MTEEPMTAELQQEFDRMHEEAIEADIAEHDPVSQSIREWVEWIHYHNDLRNG